MRLPQILWRHTHRALMAFLWWPRRKLHCYLPAATRWHTQRIQPVPVRLPQAPWRHTHRALMVFLWWPRGTPHRHHWPQRADKSVLIRWSLAEDQRSSWARYLAPARARQSSLSRHLPRRQWGEQPRKSRPHRSCWPAFGGGSAPQTRQRSLPLRALQLRSPPAQPRQETSGGRRPQQRTKRATLTASTPSAS